MLKELVLVRDDRSDGRAKLLRLRSAGRALVPTLALLVARLGLRGAPTE